jgi:hypothetical protein
VEELEVTVIRRTRSSEEGTYEVIFQENEGAKRTFKQTYSWYGPGGYSGTRPTSGSKANIRVNKLGEVVYAGSL